MEDEQIREGKREQAAREAWDKPTVLQDLRNAHHKERLAGRTYIEHLQRDHEVIYLRKMKQLGFLW
ncbi:hypothetical protein EON65_37975 [archaeon]|nr:MAG: hypothetical protein EON65_37975 [archaeon]